MRIRLRIGRANSAMICLIFYLLHDFSERAIKIFSILFFVNRGQVILHNQPLCDTHSILNRKVDSNHSDQTESFDWLLFLKAIQDFSENFSSNF